MRKIILYIAMSLDGKIADENGNVNWLVMIFMIQVLHMIILFKTLIQSSWDIIHIIKL